MTFPDLLRKAATIFGDNEAVIFSDRRLTYREVNDRARRLANALLGSGLTKGDRVATLSGNRLETFEEVCGIGISGLVRAPMYTHNTAETTAYLLNLIEASALIVEESFLADLGPYLREVPSLGTVVVHGSGGQGSVDYESFLAASAPDDPAITLADDDIHIIRFSAGTTGRPKGIVHTVRAWQQLTNELVISLPSIVETDAFIAAGTMSHGSGLWIWEMMARGARHVIMPAFDAGLFLELVERERCTQTILVPTMIALIATHPDARKRDLSSLKAVYYGAAPISERTLEEALEVWGDIMYQSYGQSESMPITILEPRHHRPVGEKSYLRSAGRPTPNSFIKILDDDDNEAAPGEIGEVCVRSPGTMRELWRDPVATAERFTADGYLRTRDIGHVTPDGFLFLSDRKEDMIISGGYNVWPAEVENALCSHPAVFEAAVVGIPHEKWGETVVAVVVLRDGCEASESELSDWCRDAIGAVRRPTEVKFASEPLPKSSVGKLLRRQVREDYWGASGQRVHGA